MRVLRRGLLVTTTCLAVSVFLSAGVSHAKKSSSTVKVKVEADLQPCGAVSPATLCDPATPLEPGAEGEAKHEKESKGGVVKKDEFKGTVKIPVDLSSKLGSIDENTAKSADIRLILSNLGGDYAECKLAFYKIEAEDDDDDDAAAVMAEYKVNVLIKKGTVVAKKGGCTDMAGAGPVVPDAQLGDVATATKVDPLEAAINRSLRTLDVDFLQGPFVKH